jgi:hypothetical protein
VAVQTRRSRPAASFCLAKLRTIETIEGSKPVTPPFLKAGDTVKIWAEDDTSRSSGR